MESLFWWWIWVAIGFNTEYFKENNLIKTSKVYYMMKITKKEKILKPLFEVKDNFDFDLYEFEKFCRKIIDEINYLSAKSKMNFYGRTRNKINSQSNNNRR